jgi:hypothetical protein
MLYPLSYAPRAYLCYSPAMGEPRFKVGELVRLHAISGLSIAAAFIDAELRNSALGIYEVVAVLPESGGQPRYRIKRDHPVDARVVRESQLVPLLRPPQSQP